MPHQTPLAVMDGGKTLDNITVELQEQQACADIANGVQLALTRLSPHHPHRGEYLALLADFQTAAGPRAAPHLALAE